MIEAGCSVGSGAFVHYGVTMSAGSELDADSFLMKGEHVPAGAGWGGNPAIEHRRHALPQRAPQIIPAQRGASIQPNIPRRGA